MFGSFYSAINRGLQFCEEFQDFPNQFIYNGVTYLGFYNDTQIIEPLEDGGYVENLDGVLIVRKATFNGVPSPLDLIVGQPITVNGRNFNVHKVTDDRLTITLVLIDTNR